MGVREEDGMSQLSRDSHKSGPASAALCDALQHHSQSCILFLQTSRGALNHILSVLLYN